MKIIQNHRLKRVCYLIELLLSSCPACFDVLLGNTDIPSQYEIHAMMNSKRVPLPDDFVKSSISTETESERILCDNEYFNASVDLAGGWKHIYTVSHELKEADCRMWHIVSDHVKFVENCSTRNASRLLYVAKKYNISKRTVMRYRSYFPLELGNMLLMPVS